MTHQTYVIKQTADESVFIGSSDTFKAINAKKFFPHTKIERIADKITSLSKVMAYNNQIVGTILLYNLEKSSLCEDLIRVCNEVPNNFSKPLDGIQRARLVLQIESIDKGETYSILLPHFIFEQNVTMLASFIEVFLETKDFKVIRAIAVDNNVKLLDSLSFFEKEGDDVCVINTSVGLNISKPPGPPLDWALLGEVYTFGIRTNTPETLRLILDTATNNLDKDLITRAQALVTLVNKGELEPVATPVGSSSNYRGNVPIDPYVDCIDPEQFTIIMKECLDNPAYLASLLIKAKLA